MKRKYMLCVVGLTLLLVGGCAKEKTDPKDPLANGTAAENEIAELGSGGDTGSDGNAGSLSGGADEGGNGSGGNAGENSDSGEGMITGEEAKAKALAHAGLAEDQVTFIKNELDYEDGRQVYEVEFYSEDHKEHDYEIDAYTGEVISFDYDMSHDAPSSGESAITAEEAKKLALERVPGASAGDIYEFETDYDDGRAQYEGKIIYNGMEYEFEIDASGGDFKSWEEERADD